MAISDWNIQNYVGGPQIRDVSTTKKLPLGTIVQAAHPAYGAGEFIYLKGVASTAGGSWVTYAMDDGGTTLLAANAYGPVGVAMAETVADRYGWYQIQGKAVGKALASFADNGRVYATATAGSVDDGAVAGDLVRNALGASDLDTPSTGMAEFEIQRPFCTDGTDVG